MNTEKLQQLGLSQNEAKIYLTLLHLGSAQAGKISKESQINRTTTYDSIRRLTEKGLTSSVIEANKKVFKPIRPQAFVKKIKEKQKIAEEILPELNQIFHEPKSEEESGIFQGRKGIKSILNDILNHKSYVAFGSSGKFLEIMKHDFEIFQKIKKQKKIQARAILSESSRMTSQVKLSHTKFRYIKDEFSSPTTTFVYGNKTAIIVWSETPIATLITSKEVANSYKKYFELLWGESHI